MIGLFPEPYPDELLYSVCARFSERVQYPGSSSVVRELFGTKNAAAVVDLPSRLGHLVAVLPPGHRYTVERLIDDHTLLPLTAMALASVVETHQEYALRRLNWATECFRSEGICPKRWQLLLRASLKPKTVALPAVKEAIEAALASLEPLTSS